MLSLINAMLDLWDPYGIYLFPEDEYRNYAIKITTFVEQNKDIKIEELTEYIFNILPPIEKAKDVDILTKIEYKRFAKLLLLILELKK